jgi:acetate kinase
MHILTINCGSSSLKFRLFDVALRPTPGNPLEVLADGQIDRIGEEGTFRARVRDQAICQPAVDRDHAAATQRMLDWLNEVGLLMGLMAIGHRIVHGGDRFHQPSIINEQVIGAIEAVSTLAPLHNRPALATIHALQARLVGRIPMVAVFDTAFHHTLPNYASHYALPLELSQKYQIRRYGFHGLAHRYMYERYAMLTGPSGLQARIITLQLGNGCSAAAIAGGRCVETSMGFTPLEGLVMGTRSGDIDASLVHYLATREQVSAAEVEQWLNTRSGLLGISGRSRDMRDLLEAESEGDSRAALAIEMFCYRIRKYIGSYLAVLGGAEAVIFGGGIGENAPAIRARIVSGMSWCGLELDSETNRQAVGIEACISPGQAPRAAYVLPVDEHVIVAQDTRTCLEVPT